MNIRFVLLLLAVPSLFAHGAPEYPISRQYNCYKNPQLLACKAAVAGGLEQALYDWNGVNQGAAGGNHQAVVPNGALCGGGKSLFRGFDLARADWPATAWEPATDGRYEFKYHATAKHATQYFRFYLTRNGFNPALQPLQWSDLDVVAEVPSSQIVTTADSRYVIRLNLPQRSGRHVLYAVWQRSDSQEAFYACSDVTFGTVTNPPGTSFTHLGQLSAQQTLPVNTVLNLRVFGTGGRDLETQSVTVTTATTAPAKWLAQLATIVNSRSTYIRVGSLQNGTVSIPANATAMEVYALPSSEQLSFQLDTVLPPGGPGTPGGGTPAWSEGSSYVVGQLVTYNGATYKCLQAHTAWVGAGWYPSADGVLNILWQKIS